MSGYDPDDDEPWFCRDCGLSYRLRRDADTCEQLHSEGF